MSTTPDHTRKDQLLREVAKCKRLIKGSIVVNRRRCGTATCSCSQGHLHESLAITYKREGKSVLVHVPDQLRQQALKAIQDYHRFKTLTDEISQINVEEFKEVARNQRARKSHCDK